MRYDGAMAKRVGALLIVMACSHARAPAPVAPAAEAVPVSAPVPVASAPEAAPACTPDAKLGALSASPGHQVLAWFVDVIAHRKGDAPRAELAEHLDAKMLGPASTITQSLHRWATDASCAVLDKIEVDDPTYLRAFIATADKRWMIILQIDPAASKMTYVRYERAH